METQGEHANSTQKRPRTFLLLGKVANTLLLYSKTKLNPLCFLSEKNVLNIINTVKDLL